MLYSHNSQYPRPIPFRIRLSNGQTRTDPTTFTEQEIADAGYIAVPDAPVITNTQVMVWNSTNLTWDVRDKTLEELYQEYVSMVPRSVTMRQARLALYQAGLLEQVDTIVAAMPESAVKIEWEYAQTVDMDSSLVQGLAAQLQLTEQQLFDLFVTASRF